MSNSLSRIESRIIGEAADEVMDEKELELSLIAADMPDAASNLPRVKARTLYGRFIAQQGTGHIIARGEYYQGAFEETMELLRAASKAKGVTLQDLINAAEAMKNLGNTATARDAVQLKAYEILAFGKNKKGRQANAPQRITGSVFQAENMQIVGGSPPQPKPVEDTPVDA